MKQYDIARFGVWSVTKMSSVLGMVMGFIAGVMLSLLSFLVPGFPPSDETAPPGADFILLLFFSRFAFLTLPVFYGVTMALMGAMWAGLYNLVAGWVGGLRFKTQSDEPAQEQPHA